jgi:site-specific DNA-methyltransferase (adenine-specific)
MPRLLSADDLPSLRTTKPKGFGEVKDEWETPPEVFKPLVMEFGGFELDPAANDHNSLGKRHYDLADGSDGLALAWYGRVWLNPPYSEWGRWARKALREVRGGAVPLVVALLPVDTSTRAFHDAIWGKAEVRFIRGRLRYYYQGVPGPHPARFSSMIVIWRKI